MSQTFDTRFNLFNGSSPDNANQRATLALELRTAHGFTLIFAVCSLWAEAKRQRASLVEELSEKHIQQIELTEETPHLLALIRATIEQPPPDAIFVYGMENWIPDHAPRKTVPFLLNLNASRNNFKKDCPSPLVLWVPEYLYGLIARDAPDFTSVHSGFYHFTAVPAEENKIHHTLEGMDRGHASALTGKEREERRVTLTELLARMQSLPADRRDKAAEFRTLGLLADTYEAQGRFSETLPLRKQALENARVQNDLWGIGSVLINLGIVYNALGHFEEAINCYEEDLKICRELQNRKGEGTTLNNLGMVYYSQGRFAEAISYYEQSLKISREFHERNLEGQTLNNLGNVYQALRHFEEAISCFEKSLKISREFRDPMIEGRALNNLGNVYRSLRHFAEAIDCVEASLIIFRKLYDHIGEGIALNNLGLVYSLQGRFEEAISCYEESLKISRKLQNRIGEGQTLSNIALIWKAQGNNRGALDTAWEALRVLETTEDETAIEKVRGWIAEWKAEV